MSNSELIAELEHKLDQSKAIRGRLTIRLNELVSEINRTRQEVREIDNLIIVTQWALIKLTASICCAEISETRKNQEAETFNALVSNLPLERNIKVLSDKFSNRSITQSTTIILNELGRPLHVNEFFRRMVEGGYIFTSDNPTISIAGSLNRNPRFRKVAPNTFDLVFREIPTRQFS